MSELRILFIGLDGSGKSTLITKLRDFKVKKKNKIELNNRMKK